MTRLRALVAAVALAGSAMSGAAEPPKDTPTSPVLTAPPTIIHAGTLIAVPGEEPRRIQSIIVRGERIEAVVSGYVEQPGARIVDLSHATVLPGLIDCHVHLTTPYRKPGEARPRGPRSDAQDVLIALENATSTLDAGFTTVRDVGADTEAIFVVRDAIDTGRFRGPRVIAAGHMISVTAGHGDDGAVGLGGSGSAPSGICDGPDQCRRAVRAQIGAGANVIKISATGGGGDDNGVADAAPEMSVDEMAAAIETAHALGRKVAAHAHGTAGINAALRAGADSIEHGGFLNEESIRLFKSHHTFLVPTLTVLNGIQADYASADPKVQPLMHSFLEQMPKNIGAAYRGRVLIAFGTDAGVTEHGKNAQEFDWYSKISMTGSDALKTATVNAAMLLGLADQIGTISTGKYADIIATAGNPLQDLATLKNVVYVMKSGVTIRDDETTVVITRHKTATF